MIRLVLSDMDNTLLPFGETFVSPRAIDAIHGLVDRGIRFAPASGRPISDLCHFFHDDPACVATALTCNGMEVVVEGEVASSLPFEHEALVRAARALEPVPGAALVAFDGHGDGRQPSLVGMGDGTSRWFGDPHVFPFGFRLLDEVPEVPMVKTAVTCDSEQFPMEELQALLDDAVPELDFLRSISDWFDVNPSGWSKADGVRVLSRELGVAPEEMVVFGDNLNDLEMLELVPDSVTVANAVPAAAEAARWHVGDCREDSVAEAMEQIAAAFDEGGLPAFMRE